MHFQSKEFNQIFPSNKGLNSIWGDFGVGKTTFALQTVLNTAKNNNGILYFYTKPNFPYKKIKTILSDESFDVLNNFFILETLDFTILKKIVFNLEFLILKKIKEDKNPLGFIIIDSITDLYRLELNKEKKEKNIKLNNELNQILATLSYINQKFSINILIINELSHISSDNQIIEAQTGKKLMDYWLLYDLKIERTEILNQRRFILNFRKKEKSIEFYLDLTDKGFKLE